jgi:hypothetical protein
MPTWTFDTPGPVRLDLELPSGVIELETVEGATTHVDLEALTPDAQELVDTALVEASPRGDGHEVRVEVRARWGFFISFSRGPHIRLRVTCAPGADAVVRSKSADLRARGRYGDFEIKTASGDASVEEIAGDARIKTASGDVSLEEVHGSTHVQSASGDVALQRAHGDVVVQSVSGDLWLRDAGASVHANTVSGDQRIEAVVAGMVEAQAVSGDIYVAVRRGSRVYVDANTISGSTNSELQLTDAPQEGEEPEVSDEAPMVEVRAKTVSGDITIARAAAPAQLPAS